MDVDTFHFDESQLAIVTEVRCANTPEHHLELFADGRIETVLEGPPHPLTREALPLTTPLEFYPADGGTGVILGDSEFVLAKGQWSDWVNISFNLLGVINVHGLVRLHLLEEPWGMPEPL